MENIMIVRIACGILCVVLVAVLVQRRRSRTHWDRDPFD
jgi:hypothetical protein